MGRLTNLERTEAKRRSLTHKQEMQEFSLIIEMMAKEKELTIMESFIEYCDKHGLELEVASKLINPELKALIKNEAAGLHFLRHKNGKVIRPTGKH